MNYTSKKGKTVKNARLSKAERVAHYKARKNRKGKKHLWQA